MTLEDGIALVEHATKKNGPSLYRTLYNLPASSAIHRISEKEWASLPFLTKDVMIATPLKDRLFIPRAEVDHLRASSGTSGKKPLFSPRTYLRHMEYRTRFHDFKRATLVYGVPAAPHWHEHFQSTLGITPRVIVFDPKNPAASVRIARIAGVDAISTFAFHITMIGDHMVREKMNQDIRLIEICGEACTRTLFDYMRATFPHATLIPFYGSSEVEDSPIGMPCRAITGEEPLSVYHAKKSQYHELIRPETLEVIPVESGAEGELIITAYPGEPSAFPLIRYRTGDMVRVVESQCTHHNSWSFTVVGRVELDFIKVSGGVVRADEAERVVRLLGLKGQFELHYFERATPEGPKVQLEMHIESGHADDMQVAAEKIAAALRINASTTYAEGVMKGRFLPLTCVPYSAPVGKKSKRLVRH